jgi:hypothetical protein
LGKIEGFSLDFYAFIFEDLEVLWVWGVLGGFVVIVQSI